MPNNNASAIAVGTLFCVRPRATLASCTRSGCLLSLFGYQFQRLLLWFEAADSTRFE